MESPYKFDNQGESYFGIPVITEDQQLELLRKMTPKYQPNKELKNNIPVSWRPGYCKSMRCRQVMKPAAKYALFHCEECLSQLLVRSRRESSGPNILLEFVANNNNTTDSYDGKLEFRIEKGKFYINSKEVQGRFKPRENRDQYIIFTFVVESDFTVDNHSLLGVFCAKFIGRYVCKNIMLGNKCISMDANYKPTDFATSVVLPGMPHWRERLEPDSWGRIHVTDLCNACYEISPDRKQDWAYIKRPNHCRSCAELEKKLEELKLAYYELKEELNEKDKLLFEYKFGTRKGK